MFRVGDPGVRPVLLAAHAAVVTLRDAVDQGGIRSGVPAGAELDAHAAVGLGPNRRCHADGTPDAARRAGVAIQIDDPHAFILQGADGGRPGTLERARHGRVNARCCLVVGAALKPKSQAEAEEQGAVNLRQAVHVLPLVTNVKPLNLCNTENWDCAVFTFLQYMIGRRFVTAWPYLNDSM